MRLRRVPVPGDGTCFFHAVGVSLGMHGMDVRRECAAALIKLKDTEFNGLTFEQWVQHGEAVPLEAYARRVARDLWGGGLEMAVLATQFGRPIVVYAASGPVRGGPAGPDNGGQPARKIATFCEHQRGPPVFLLYENANHYSALIKWRPSVPSVPSVRSHS